MIPANTGEQVVFFGSKEYVPLFAALTGRVRNERVVFYNSVTPPLAPGCKLVTFETRTRTNWQYECRLSPGVPFNLRRLRLSKLLEEMTNEPPGWRHVAA